MRVVFALIIFIIIHVLNVCNSYKCLITQQGKDGIGHQMEGKISCLLLAELDPKFLEYYHTRFIGFDHTSVSTEIVEQFFRLELSSPVTKSGFRKVNGNDVVLSDILTSKKQCQSNDIIVLDNCWSIAYKDPYVSKLFELDMLSKLSQNIGQDGPRKLVYNPGQVNVFVHLRRGDSIGRASPFVHVKLAMMHIHSKLPNAHFWIDSDSPHWPDMQPLKALYPNRTTMLFELREDFNVLDTFFHLIHADAIIMSYSSFSITAAFLARNTSILVAPPKGFGWTDKYLRQELFSLQRFHSIPRKTLKRHFMAAHHKHGTAERVIPFVGKSEKSLLALVDKAEKRLKIFVYPIPSSATRCKRSISDYRYEMETRLNKYFFNHKIIRTKKPEEADFFLIEHEWVCLLLESNSPTEVFSKHVQPVLKAVRDDYPYFKLRGGSDHLFVAVMDGGPFCHVRRKLSSRPEFVDLTYAMLWNATVIRNSGATPLPSGSRTSNDRTEAEMYPQYCFRMGSDIAIPPAKRFFTRDWYQVQIRKWDTQFEREAPSKLFSSGTDVSSAHIGNRLNDAIITLDAFSATGKEAAEDRSRILWRHGGRYPDVYFVLVLGGETSWNGKLYDGILDDTVPVLLTDALVVPYERFLDWRTFTVKVLTGNSDGIGADVDILSSYMNSSTSSAPASVSGRYSRESLRVKEKYATTKTGIRGVLNEGHYPTKLKMPLQLLAEIKDWSSVARDAAKLGLSLGQSTGVLYSQKVHAMRLAAPWLVFSDEVKGASSFHNTTRCAFRMLVAELFCRTEKAREYPVLFRTVCASGDVPASLTAWKSYV